MPWHCATHMCSSRGTGHRAWHSKTLTVGTMGLCVQEEDGLWAIPKYRSALVYAALVKLLCTWPSGQDSGGNCFGSTGKRVAEAYASLLFPRKGTRTHHPQSLRTEQQSPRKAP